MDLERLRDIVLRGRNLHGYSQEEAAEKAGVSLDQWKTLEQPGNTRRTAIRLPQDRALIDGVARVIGRDSGVALMEEAGLL